MIAEGPSGLCALAATSEVQVFRCLFDIFTLALSSLQGIMGLPVALVLLPLLVPRHVYCTVLAMPFLIMGPSGALCNDQTVPEVHIVHRVGFVLLRGQWDCCTTFCGVMCFVSCIIYICVCYSCISFMRCIVLHLRRSSVVFIYSKQCCIYLFVV